MGISVGCSDFNISAVLPQPAQLLLVHVDHVIKSKTGIAAIVKPLLTIGGIDIFNNPD